MGSVSDSAAESGFPTARMGAQAIAGPTVTLVLMLVCALALRKSPDSPIWITALFALPIRFAVGVVYLYFSASAAIQGIPPGQPNFDESNAAQAFGFAVELLLIVELVLTVGLWTWAVQRMTGATRISALAGAVLGIATGISVWIAFLGPLLLP
jgi:hypothetical protein